LKGSRKIGGW